MFRCFLVKDFQYKHEQEAFTSIFANLRKKYEPSKSNFNLIIQPFISSLTPDLLIISNNLIAVADIKSGKGKITGNENSLWFAENSEINKGRENPFAQIHRYKFDLLNFLKEKIHFYFDPKFIDSNLNLGHIKGFIIFDGLISYDDNQLNEATKKWFKVTCASKFHEDIESPYESKINLNDSEIDTLIFKIFNIHPDQQIYQYPLEKKPIEVVESEPRKKVNIPLKISVEDSLPDYKKILRYYRYCLVLEDIKNSEIPESSIKIKFDKSPLDLKSFSLKTTDELKSFLEKQSFYSKSQKIQLLMAYPIYNEKVPLFICSLDFNIDQGKVIFSISNDFEISKMFISKILGISEPEQLEFIKYQVDSTDSFEEKIKIIQENINPETSRITPDSFIQSLSSKEAYIFWGSWGTNFKVIKELEDIEKNNTQTPEFLSFVKPSALNLPTQTPASILPFSKLNREQLLAVESAFKNRLTVVTGPPGTGKTQVSYNILANAIINGKTVLFSTKNNKAVDDVCKKFEALFTDNSITPIIRVGNKEVMNSIPDKLTKTIKAIENLKKQDQTLIKNIELEIKLLNEKIEKLEKQIQEFQQLQSTRVSISNEIDYLKSLKEFYSIIKEKIIYNLNTEKEKILSKIPEPFINFFYKSKKSYPIPKNTIKKHLDKLQKKLSGKVNIIEKLILIFNKNYINKKFLKIFEHLASPLEPQLLTYIKKSSNTLIDLFKNLLLIKSWESEIHSVFNLDKKIKDEQKSLEDIKRNLNDRISNLEAELKQKDKKISELKPHIPEINNELEKLKSKLIEKSKAYLLNFYLNSLAQTSIPYLQKFKSHVENSQTIPTTLFREVLKVFPIFATTNLSAANAIPLEPQIFDILIIDEASQSDIPSALPLILRSKNIVIIGDPMQLIHISTISDKEDVEISKRCKIPEPMFNYYTRNSLYSISEQISNLSLKPVIFLSEHYRCHESIIQFSNNNFYSHIGKELIIKTPPENIKFKPYQGIFWIHVPGEERNKINKEETEAIKRIIISLIKPYLNQDITLGVTTPFRNQADFLQKQLRNLLRPDIDVVDTVHRFQGDEKDVMILSLVVSPNSESSLLWFINQSAKQLLNVAVTRARSCIFIVGNYEFASKPKKGRFTTDYIKALSEHSTPLPLNLI